MPSEPNPAPKFEPRRFIPSALALLASLLTLIACFQPFFRTETSLNQGFGDDDLDRYVSTQGAWSFEMIVPGEAPLSYPGPPLGFPLMLAAAVLLAAAIVGIRYASAPARWFASAGAVFLTGVVATSGMQGLTRADSPIARDTTVTVGLGQWLLITAVVVAVAGAIASHRLRPEPLAAPGNSDLADMATPRDGFSITLLPAEPPPSSEPPDYSAFAPPPDTDRRERD